MKYTKLLLLLLFVNTLLAQSDTSKIYSVVDKMPLFPGCTNDSLDERTCSDQKLLDYVYQHIIYPDSARMNNIEGMVVLSFVIEKDGLLSQAKILKDIGGGCGSAALSAINTMNGSGIRWQAGTLNEVPARVRVNLPVRFKLKELPPYVLIDNDTVYTQWDIPLQFVDGDSALQQFIKKELDYPEHGNDSCTIGVIELKALVQQNGDVKVIEINDYSDLRFDYQFEAVRIVHATAGKWKPAHYQGRPVPTTVPFRIIFQPTAANCEHIIQNFDKAYDLVLEGTQSYNAGNADAGLAKMDEGISYLPNNTEFLLARGQIHLKLNNFEAACADLHKVKKVLVVSPWLNQIMGVICK